jgi:perosamine synthetase
LYRGRPVGSLGDVACFSFNGSKIATSGGGGALTTSRESWAARARYLATQAKDDPVEYVHGAVGYNYRMPNINAAIACAQLEQLDGFLARKREIAVTYANGLANRAGFGAHPAADWATPTYWLYTIVVNEHVAGIGSRDLLRRLAAEQITARPLWHPIPALPLYRDCESVGGAVASRLYREALCVPSATTLRPDQQDRVIRVLRQREADAG